MATCTIETGLLRKKPCGHVAVANCISCDQPLCVEHAVAQLTGTGHRTGKFMCKECVAAAKEHDKNMASVARSQEAKKQAAIEKGLRAQATAPAPVKKPAASAPAAPAQPAPAGEAKPPDALDALEFTPKDGKFGYTKKED